MISKMRITLILKILKSENKEINHSIYLTKKYGVMGNHVVKQTAPRDSREEIGNL